MKTLIRFLSVLLCIAPFGVANAVVSSTAGSNLTAYNGESGATNNNRWNAAMNSRTVGGGGTNATADFGNCNAVVMRCAQPKCANGGCTDLMVTSSIVSGCVQSSAQCKQYGDDLVQYISAQLVASSTAKANASAAAAQTAAANAAAQQSAQQMAQMQQQMQQMQAQMAAQNAETVAQLQSALAEQKQMTANAIAEATTARESASVAQTSNNDLSNVQIAAAERGVSADVLAREQITGQIMSAIENAEVQLKTLNATMKDVFDYAGCDSRGNNCTGPKRVKMFKQKAEGFFDPYETVLDELYDALILAQSVGVDITDVYMMLNGTCNVWGQYLCIDGQVMHYTADNCVDGRSVENYYENDEHKRLRGGAPCTIGQVVPMSDGGCQLIKMLTSKEEVQRNWLNPEDGEDGDVRVGCASESLDNSTLFRGRKRQANIDIETLQKIIAQDDVPSNIRTRGALDNEKLKYCAITAGMYSDLQKLVTTKTLPKSDICIDERKLNRNLNNTWLANDDSVIEIAREACSKQGKYAEFSNVLYRCFCEKTATSGENCDSDTSKTAMAKAEKELCTRYGAKWDNDNNTCDCESNYEEDAEACNIRFNQQTTSAGGGSSGNSVENDRSNR